MSDGNWNGAPPNGSGPGWPPQPGAAPAQPQAPQSGWGAAQPPQPGWSPPSPPAQPPTAPGWGATPPPPQPPGAWQPQGAPQQAQPGPWQPPAQAPSQAQPGAWNGPPQQPGQAPPFGAPQGQPPQPAAWGPPQGQPPAAWGAPGGGFPAMPRPVARSGGMGRIVGGSVAAGVIGVIAVGSAILRGGFNTTGGTTDWRAQATSSITSTFIDGINEGDHASNLCGFRVSRANSLNVTNVQILTGGPMTGQASASLTAYPVPAPGVVPLPGPCAAAYQFRYTITRTGPIRNQTVHTNLDDLHLYRPLTLGTMISATLQDGDETLDSGAYRDDYGFPLGTGQSVTFSLRGGPSITTPGRTLEVAAAVVQNGAVLTPPSDAAGNTVTHFVFTAPSAGLYFLRVVAAPNQTGAYQLQAYPGVVPNPA